MLCDERLTMMPWPHGVASAAVYFAVIEIPLSDSQVAHGGNQIGCLATLATSGTVIVDQGLLFWGKQIIGSKASLNAIRVISEKSGICLVEITDQVVWLLFGMQRVSVEPHDVVCNCRLAICTYVPLPLHPQKRRALIACSLLRLPRCQN